MAAMTLKHKSTFKHRELQHDRTPSWIWVTQLVVIIAAVAAGFLAIMWVMRRGGPTWHHVITHEVSKSWEEVRAEIEAPERGQGLKLLWVYHGPHDQRQNGSPVGGGPSPSS
jgi:hypothetical protein